MGPALGSAIVAAPGCQRIFCVNLPIRVMRRLPPLGRPLVVGLLALGAAWG